MALEFSEAVGRIPAYPAAGGYALAEPIVALASNETPYPPIEQVQAAITRAARGVNRYPDPTGAALRRALADRHGVVPERITIGNGSCDILLAAGAALLEPGAEVVFAWPSFSEYPHLAAATGATEIRVPLDFQQRHDLDAMAQQITVATRLVIVCNPNNPTGTALPLDAIAQFVAGVPRHACVILDEAYCDFNLLDDPDASIDLLDRHPNLMLLRTFSKAHGLCGLRVGYGLCGSDELPAALNRVRQPFHCNAVAQAAAVESLAHLDVIAQRVTQTIAARMAMDEGLRELGLTPTDSQANFLWFDLGEGVDEDAVLAGLAERGVLVRAGSALGRPGALRVTCGSQHDGEAFLSALAAVLRSAS